MYVINAFLISQDQDELENNRGYPVQTISTMPMIQQTYYAPPPYSDHPSALYTQPGHHEADMQLVTQPSGAPASSYTADTLTNECGCYIDGLFFRLPTVFFKPHM